MGTARVSGAAVNWSPSPSSSLHPTPLTRTCSTLRHRLKPFLSTPRVEIHTGRVLLYMQGCAQFLWIPFWVSYTTSPLESYLSTFCRVRHNETHWSRDTHYRALGLATELITRAWWYYKLWRHSVVIRLTGQGQSPPGGRFPIPPDSPYLQPAVSFAAAIVNRECNCVMCQTIVVVTNATEQVRQVFKSLTAHDVMTW